MWLYFTSLSISDILLMMWMLRSIMVWYMMEEGTSSSLLFHMASSYMDLYMTYHLFLSSNKNIVFKNEEISIPIAIMMCSKNEFFSFQICTRGILAAGFLEKESFLERFVRIVRIMKNCNYIPKNMFCKRSIAYSYCGPLSPQSQK